VHNVRGIIIFIIFYNEKYFIFFNIFIACGSQLVGVHRKIL